MSLKYNMARTDIKFGAGFFIFFYFFLLCRFISDFAPNYYLIIVKLYVSRLFLNVIPLLCDKRWALKPQQNVLSDCEINQTPV